MDVFLLFLILCGAGAVQSQSAAWQSSESQTGPQHTVEMLMVMDKMAFDVWYEKTAGEEEEDRQNRTLSRVADFLASIVVGVNNLYGSVSKYGLSLDVRLKKIHILEHDIWKKKDLREELGGRLDRPQIAKDRAIRLFYRWLWTVRAAVGIFDHALLITGYDLVDPQNLKKSTQGVAYQGVMCRYGSLSVMENDYTYQLVDTAAHELGHSLGCDHDEGTKCKTTLGHVMSTRTEINSTNRWSFSPCSADAMINNIAELNKMNANCLLRTTTSPTSGAELGQLMGPDQQCRMILGPEAFFCREFYPTPEAYGKMCTSIWCSASPQAAYCLNYIASDGFGCGQDKVCRRGNCTLLQSPQSTPVPADACPQGDQPGVVHENMTCSEVTTVQPWLCYRTFFHSKCCHTCSKIAGDVPGCEYGDKDGWCHTEPNYPFDCYGNNNTCCQSCLKYRHDDKPGCEYGDHTQECKTKLSIPIGCYENEARCCETCAKAKSTTNNEECPYGDRSTWCRDKMQVPNGCYLNQELCCGTCGHVANVTLTTRSQEAESSQNDTESSWDDKPLNWCLYGDRYPEWCQRESPFVCYNSTRKEWCCQTCATFEKEDQSGCEYGDRDRKCEGLVYPYACYDSDSARLCCHTCGLYRNTSRPDCLYGDHEAWCYKLNEKYSTEQWCHMDLETGHCCGTCIYGRTDIPVFGSRVKKLGLPEPK